MESISICSGSINHAEDERRMMKMKSLAAEICSFSSSSARNHLQPKLVRLWPSPSSGEFRLRYMPLLASNMSGSMGSCLGILLGDLAS